MPFGTERQPSPIQVKGEAAIRLAMKRYGMSEELARDAANSAELTARDIQTMPTAWLAAQIEWTARRFT